MGSQYAKLFCESNARQLQLPGFQFLKNPYGGLSFPVLSVDPIKRQFDDFVDRVCDSLGKEYYPIYRMADGEFEFLVGWKASLPRDRRIHPAMAWFRQFAKGTLRKLKGKKIPTMWGEAYLPHERSVARQRLIDGIHHTAKHGSLALYFAIRADHWCEQYFKPVCDWFDCEKIVLDSRNYIPFYFVYGLMNGPNRRRLYDNRHLLVVTHLQESRVQRVREKLLELGCASVQFVPISSNRSLLDNVDLSVLKRQPDLALVAGGIGSVNVLKQLEPLQIPCIDCGIGLECLIDDRRRIERPFLLSDEDLAKDPQIASELKFSI